MTFDLGVIEDGPRRGSAYDAINAEALRCFVWALADADELFVLDWQHPAYRFRPAVQALTPQPEWKVPVYPDGDYYAFLTADLREGHVRAPVGADAVRDGRAAGRLVGSVARHLASRGAPRRPTRVSRETGGLLLAHVLLVKNRAPGSV